METKAKEIAKPKIPFRERLKKGVLVCDGAMGTELYNKGIFINRCFEELNIRGSNLVREVHRGYVDAGAEILETNTYGANRYKLTRYGLEGNLEAINRKGVEIAREEAGDKAYIAGAVGPIGTTLSPIGSFPPEQAREFFNEHIKALVDSDIDLLLLETFLNLDELKIAIEEARKLAPDLPIIAQMTIAENGQTMFGVSPEEIAQELSKQDIDAIGLNCTVGPKKSLEAMIRMRHETDLPLSIQPNAGFPQLVDGRMIYLATPEYFSEYSRRMIHKAHVNIIGGCCGTTPAHIKAIRGAVRMLQPGSTIGAVQVDEEEEVHTPEGVTLVPEETKSPLAAKLKAGKFVVSIEIDPPHGTILDKALAAAELCAKSDVDCINIADGPRATARMGPVSMALLLREKFGIDPIIHFCCRDRNILGLQADLMGMDALDLNNVLIITGDPPKLGDYPDATAVFDVDAIGLLKIANRLNHGLDLAGKPIGNPTGLFIGCGANPGAMDFEEEIRRLEMKVKAGAQYILTQPVYDLKLFEKFHEAAEPYDIPILVGILPLSSYRNAEFLHNEVPGMSIPKPIMERMEKVGSGPKAKAEGVAIARDAYLACRDLAQGVYIMPPFNRVQAALDVLYPSEKSD